ncbi:39S ribosomal protein L3, mitochondrial-like isoform X2 [Stegodyphus dumicola]|uniref:39S ribosomal protein L3, mitochondrial-like isoform X2 n=1 Tax=Stegodyphus dumicola TaxID=202533 RepID=UPI0015B1CEB3|nr:39S ribosomal protein L3, mitochondrial-like isoform X2 [Stegodyphus dumicola]
MFTTHLISRITSCAFSSIKIVEHKLIVTCTFIPVRDKHGIRKQRGIYDNYWVPKKRKYTDDKITSENRDFLQEVISERFLKPGESPLKNQVENERAKWTPNSVRTGLIARKIGIYPMWTKDGKRILTTLLQVVDNHVIRYNPPEIFSQSKYSNVYLKDKSKVLGSLVVGAESADPQLFTAAYNGLFAESGVMPKKRLTYFRITPDAKIEPGTPLFANHFRVGDYVNIRGITRYHGFQGVMKRWGFKGGPATHGCTKSHRRPGCIGGGRKRGVWKGKKMPGLMGGYRRLMAGLKIWRINTKYNVIYVQGRAVPGVTNNYCYIYDCYKEKKRHTEDNPPPFPTYYPEDSAGLLPEDIFDEKLHNFSDPSIIVEETESNK